MHAHHAAAIDRVVDAYGRRDDVEAILLAGSIAHGFERADSDVDVMLVVSDTALARHSADHDLAFSDTELAGYDGGYIDVKYVSPGYLRRVAATGSEPARFAFAGAQILRSSVEGLDELVADASRYPSELKLDRIARFHAQLLAWNWLTGEAEKKQDPYLMATAVSRLLLFGGRLVLAHNETLYPFHKWYLRVLDGVADAPTGLVPLMREVAAAPSADGAARFFALVEGFREWEVGDVSWPNHFLHDTEQAWMRDAAAIEDL